MESGLKVLSVKKIASRPSGPKAELVSDSIPIAERCGRIGAIGVSVLYQACSTLSEWTSVEHGASVLSAPADAVRDFLSRPWGLRRSGGLYAA